MIQTIEEKIRQRRRQMLVHSYIYYELDQSLISDSKWSEWAKELEQLQKDYPEESQSVEGYEQFKDWDGSSGAFLKFGENIKTVAKILLESQNQTAESYGLVSDFAKKSQNKQLNSKKMKSNTRSLF